MPNDTLSYHPNPLPTETYSVFKKFILIQDEVPDNFKYYSNQYSNIQKADSLFAKKIIQQKPDSEKTLTTSVFKDNLLKVQQNNSIPNKSNSDYWGLFIFIFCLLILMIIKTTYSKRLSQIIKSFFNPRLMPQLNRDGNIFNERITAFIYPIYFISFGFIIYEVITLVFSNKINYQGYLIYLLCLVGFIIFYFTKYLLIKTISIIFLTKRETDDYLLNQLIFNFVIVLVIFPGAFLIFYAQPQLKIIFLIGLAIIFSLIMIYRIIRSFFIGISLNKFSHFYLILYLCTVDIIPILLILRFLYNYLN